MGAARTLPRSSWLVVVRFPDGTLTSVHSDTTSFVKAHLRKGFKRSCKNLAQERRLCKIRFNKVAPKYAPTLNFEDEPKCKGSLFNQRFRVERGQKLPGCGGGAAIYGGHLAQLSKISTEKLASALTDCFNRARLSKNIRTANAIGAFVWLH